METQELDQSALVIDHGETRTVDQGQEPDTSELQRHKEARGYVKPVEQPQVEQPEQVAEPEAAVEAPKKPERWVDPDTHDTYDMRHKVARRIKTVLEERGKLRGEVEALRRERDDLMRAMIQRGVPAEEAKQAATAQVNASQADPEPDPADTTKYPEGQFDRAFIRDQARWAARQETNARLSSAQHDAQEHQRIAAEQTAITSWQKTLPEARQKYEDFDSALERIPNDAQHAPIVRLMMGSPVGNDLVYVLATKQDHEGVPLLQRYRTFSPDQRERFLYHIEAQLIQARRAATTRAASSTTKAPQPTSPVNTGANAAGPVDWSKSDDPDQYQRWKASRGSRR